MEQCFLMSFLMSSAMRDEDSFHKSENIGLKFLDGDASITSVVLWCVLSFPKAACPKSSFFVFMPI